MVAGTALLWFWGMAPKVANISLVTWIVFPSALATMIGACVPHIYRVSLARAAAAARRASAMQQTAMPPQEPRVVLISGASDTAADPTVPRPQHFDKAA
jgi:hypothetical protein